MRRIPHDEFGRKRCSKCHEYKPISEFSKNKGRADGYTDKCKKCRSIAKDKKWQELVKQQLKNGLRWCNDCQEFLPLNQFYYIKSVERYDSYCKEHSKARANAFRKATNYNHKYYTSDLQGQRARAKEWRKNNPDKKLVQKQRRRALIKGVGGTFSVDEWNILKTRCGNRCLSCGQPEPIIQLEPDHIIPIAKGGSNDITNIQPLCRTCNASKNAKVIDFRPKD